MEIHFWQMTIQSHVLQAKGDVEQEKASEVQRLPVSNLNHQSTFNCWLQRNQLPAISSKSTNKILKDILLPRSAKTHSVIATVYKDWKD